MRSTAREIIVARPFDEAAQRCRDGRNGDDLIKIAQPVVADRLGRAETVVLPHHTAHPPRPERRDDDAAERGFAPLRNAIVERAEGGGQEEDAGAGHELGQDIGLPVK
jgi:hypothetical protein